MLTEISSDRPTKDFGKIVDNILEHLVIMGDTNIEITLEINAEASDGITKDKRDCFWKIQMFWVLKM